MTGRFTCFFFWMLFMSGLALGFKECRLSTSGADYRGNVSVTTSGRTCQAWNSQSPHSHGFSSLDLFPDNTDEQRANYCRNPNYSDVPWCYTTDPDQTWEYCDIPRCWPYAECKRTEKGTEYRGSLSVTASGRACEPWSQMGKLCKNDKCIDGHVLANTDENFCRNPDGDDLPWCLVGMQDWEYCDVPYCKPSATCITSGQGENYVGTVSETVDSIACQRWDEQFPHSHNYTDATAFPEESLGDAENYCRNPDGKTGGPWCYTTDPSVEFQYCDVPLCADCKHSATGNEYAGTVTRTISGLACQWWSAQTPHAHNYTDINRFPDNSFQDARNYCRNPTGSEHNQGPWCYTTDPEVEWEYCEFPSCDVCEHIQWTTPTGGNLYAGCSKDFVITNITCSGKPLYRKIRSPASVRALRYTGSRWVCSTHDPEAPCGGGVYRNLVNTNPYPTGISEDVLGVCKTVQARVPMVNHVLYIGIGGLKPSCIPDAPALNRLAEEGTHTLTNCRTCAITLTGPAFATSLCGMDVSYTGVTRTAAWTPTWMGGNEDLSPVTGRDIMMPCVLHELKSRDANFRTAAFYDANWLKYMFNMGYPGYVDYESSFNNNPRDDDEMVKEEAVKYLRDNLVSAEKSFTFVHLGDVDATAQSQGWCEEEYMAAVDRADVRVGEILDVIDELGMQDQVLVILSADRAGLGTRTGDYADSDIHVPMYIRGPRIRKNVEFTRTVRTEDIVPTAFYALGLEPSSWWTGRVMQEAFEK